MGVTYRTAEQRVRALPLYSNPPVELPAVSGVVCWVAVLANLRTSSTPFPNQYKQNNFLP